MRSTKVVAGRELIEKLPARLNMPLDVYEESGALHFVSRGYYFDLGLVISDLGRGLKLWLPRVFSPGVTHVEHVDLGHGWFRFTMIVMHPLFGEMFFQTGRFCAFEEKHEHTRNPLHGRDRLHRSAPRARAAGARRHDLGVGTRCREGAANVRRAGERRRHARPDSIRRAASMAW